MSQPESETSAFGSNASASTSSSTSPLINQRVLISGLQNRPDLNGKIGIVTSFDSQRNRFYVQLQISNSATNQNVSQHQYVALKEENLIITENLPRSNSTNARGGYNDYPSTSRESNSTTNQINFGRLFEQLTAPFGKVLSFDNLGLFSFLILVYASLSSSKRFDLGNLLMFGVICVVVVYLIELLSTTIGATFAPVNSLKSLIQKYRDVEMRLSIHLTRRFERPVDTKYVLASGLVAVVAYKMYMQQSYYNYANYGSDLHGDDDGYSGSYSYGGFGGLPFWNKFGRAEYNEFTVSCDGFL